MFSIIFFYIRFLIFFIYFDNRYWNTLDRYIYRKMRIVLETKRMKKKFTLHTHFLFYFLELSLSQLHYQRQQINQYIDLPWMHRSFRPLLLTYHCVLQLCLFGNSNLLLCLTALLVGNKHLVLLGLLSTLK